MKVLIATKVLRRIEAAIILTIGYGGYKVLIREVETISQVFFKAPHLSLCTSKDDKISDNVVPGFEDIDDNISHHEIEGKEQGSSPIQNYSNETKVKETTSSNGSGQHATSQRRTATVSFSQNGYSEELLKVNQHLSKVAVVKEIEESQKEKDSQPPSGFEFEFTGDIKSQDHNSTKRTTSNCYAKQRGLDEECLSDQTNIICRTDIEKVCTNQNSQEHYQEVPKELNFKKALVQSNSEHTCSDSDSLV